MPHIDIELISACSLSHMGEGWGEVRKLLGSMFVTSPGPPLAVHPLRNSFLPCFPLLAGEGLRRRGEVETFPPHPACLRRAAFSRQGRRDNVGEFTERE